MQAYNTKLIKKESLPKTYRDLLDQKWKGKLGVEGKDEDWFASVVDVTGGGENGLKFFRDLVATNGLSVRQGHTLLNNLVISGEVPLALNIYNYMPEQAKKKGAPIDWFAIEPAIARSNGVGVARHAPHPNAAMLFYEYLLGPTMTYTCACYPTPTSTLDEAQTYKHELVFRKLGLGATLHGRLDPLDDLAVAIGLRRLEIELVDVPRQRAAPHREELVAVGRDLSAGPGDLRDGLRHLAELGLDRLRQRRLLDREGPSRLHEHADGRNGMVSREHRFESNRGRVVLLGRDAEAELRGRPFRSALGFDLDVSGRGTCDEHDESETEHRAEDHPADRTPAAHDWRTPLE